MLVAGCARRPAEFTYLWQNGRVFLTDEKAGIVYSNANGKEITFKRGVGNSLVLLPLVEERIPVGADPFSWRPEITNVRARIVEWWKGMDDPAQNLSDDLKKLLATSGRDAVIDRMAEWYCSFNEQKGRPNRAPGGG